LSSTKSTATSPSPHCPRRRLFTLSIPLRDPTQKTKLSLRSPPFKTKLRAIPKALASTDPFCTAGVWPALREIPSLPKCHNLPLARHVKIVFSAFAKPRALHCSSRKARRMSSRRQEISHNPQRPPRVFSTTYAECHSQKPLLFHSLYEEQKISSSFSIVS